jgi:hypothetical protein
MIGRIATGEIAEEFPSGIRGAAGGAARAARLPADERRAIASKAAKARWQGPQNEVGSDMMQTASKETVAAHGRKAACMYPNNSLREPVREFEDTVFDLLRKSFTK